jgi:uncharacterized protein (TIGR03905 family)
MTTIDYKTSGVCASKITAELDNGVVRNVHFEGGCPGNTLGLAGMVEGVPIEDVISRLSGIPCGKKPTSCPDQLALALKQAISEARAEPADTII